jgi:hypothetical protein
MVLAIFLAQPSQPPWLNAWKPLIEQNWHRCFDYKKIKIIFLKYIFSSFLDIPLDTVYQYILATSNPYMHRIVMPLVFNFEIFWFLEGDGGGAEGWALTILAFWGFLRPEKAALINAFFVCLAKWIAVSLYQYKISINHTIAVSLPRNIEDFCIHSSKVFQNSLLL